MPVDLLNGYIWGEDGDGDGGRWNNVRMVVPVDLLLMG